MVKVPWVAWLVALARSPERARKLHLLTSSTTYSYSASHDPLQPTSRFTLPVSKTVPGSTVCQHDRS